MKQKNLVSFALKTFILRYIDNRLHIFTPIAMTNFLRPGDVQKQAITPKN